MSARRGRPWAQGVPPGEGVGQPSWTLMGVRASRLARALSKPLKRRLTLTEGRTTEAKRRSRRGIAERGEDHMKGKKAFIRAVRRPSKPAQPAKVLSRIKSRAAELVAEAAQGIVELKRWLFLWKTAIPHGRSVNLNEQNQIHLPRSKKMPQPRLDTHRKGRGIVGRAGPALAPEVAPLHEPHGTKIKSIICNGRQKQPPCRAAV
jgi:hypothetical protein